MKELEQLNLTEADFKLIFDGLDFLPSKNLAGDIMFEMLSMALLKDDDEERVKLKNDRKIKQQNEESAKQLLIEEVRILQGKILSLQRYLRMNGLLKEANNIIKV